MTGLKCCKPVLGKATIPISRLGKLNLADSPGAPALNYFSLNIVIVSFGNFNMHKITDR